MNNQAERFLGQVAIACMVQGAEVHVNELPVLPGSNSTDWRLDFCLGSIIVRGAMTAAQFSVALGDMDVNIHLLSTEALLDRDVIGHSLALGVPIITAATSPWFSSSPRMRSLLVEPRIDDPSAMYRRLLQTVAFVTHHRELFSAEVETLLSASHEMAVASWNCFISGLRRGVQEPTVCMMSGGAGSNSCKVQAQDIIGNYKREQVRAVEGANLLASDWKGDLLQL
jgi:hypothetical protein